MDSQVKVENITTTPLNALEINQVEKSLLNKKTKQARLLPIIAIDGQEPTEGWFFNATTQMKKDINSQKSTVALAAYMAIGGPLAVVEDLEAMVLIDGGSIISWPVRELLNYLKTTERPAGKALIVLTDPAGKVKKISNRNFNALVDALKTASQAKQN